MKKFIGSGGQIGKKNVNGIVIGISGKIGTGKTTLTNWAVKNKEFEQCAFADNIKLVTSIVTATTFEQNLSERSLKPGFDGFNGRTLSQLHVKIGEDFRKEYSPKVWIHSITPKIDDYINNGKDVIVSDVRTPVEADWLKEKYHAYLIRLKRPLHLRKEHLKGRDPNSKIEKALDNYEKFDCVIKNNTKKLENLYKKFPLL